MRALVVGAGGRFAAIAEQLLERGHDVRVTSRDPASDPARSLAGIGAEILAADFEDIPSLTAAARGVEAVLASGTAHHAGPNGEARHGRNLVAALEAAGAPHLVFVSGDGAAPDSPLPLLRAKWSVEEAIEAARLPATVLAPTYLMENLFNPWNLDALRAGILPSPVSVDRPLQQTALADILALAVVAIEDPGRFAGRRIRLASDELTASAAADAISEVIPRTLEPRRAPLDQLPPGVRVLFDWLETSGHDVDLGALRDELPMIGWHSYGAWAAEQLNRFREICPHPEPVAG